MAEDIDDASRFGALPCSGSRLRQHYRNMLRNCGIEDTLADARRRYEAQVAGTALPLTEVTP